MRFNNGAFPFLPATDKDQLKPGALGVGMGGRDTLWVPRRDVFLAKEISIPITDSGGAAGGQGGLQIFQFPEGVIQIMGAYYDLTIRRSSTGIAAGAAVVGALGSVVAGAADSTLTTTEADMIASTVGTLTAGAGLLQKHGSLVAAAFDGHTTPLKAFLNLAIPDADISATDAIIVNGVIAVNWYLIGDWT